jgi:group I intron endonuclease
MKKATNKPIPKPISGIYAIHCISKNKWYIGSSNNIARRLNTHKRELNNGSHNNLLLQRDYNELGPSSFSFLILIKDVPEEMLLAYEKVMMYKYDSVVRYKGYNQMFSTVNHKLFKQAYQELIERGVIDRTN